MSSRPTRYTAPARRLVLSAATGPLVSAAAARATAQASSRTTSERQDPRWTPIRRVFGQGEAEGGYFRTNLPRRDLHVRIGEDALDPGFEFTSYVGFMPAGSGSTGVLAVGEVILLQDEVPAVLAEARRQGVSVTAVHNHLIGETPRIVYVHVMAQGTSESVATKLRRVFATTATPLEPPTEERGTGDWTAIDAVLGKHSEAKGRVAEYVFPRRERLTIRGMPVKSVGTLETASEVVFHGRRREARPGGRGRARAHARRDEGRGRGGGVTRYPPDSHAGFQTTSHRWPSGSWKLPA